MLKEKIVREIRKKGFITFDRFVEICLYDEEFGYYTKKRIGTYLGEDFVTAPEVSESFGKTVANYLEKRTLELSLPLKILELGGGKGFLAKDIVETLNPESYTILEVRKKPEWLKGINWVKSLKEVEPFEGVVISNEFFDAFPFKRIKKLNGELREVVVREKNGELYEDTVPFRGEIPCEIEEENEYCLFVGWKEFLKELFQKLKRGLFLTFDYGGKCREISGRKSFRAFRENRLVEDYLNYPGETDLTALVNFDYLSSALERAGFTVERLTHQSSFLLENGIEKFLEPGEVPQALMLLVDMGRKFKVLEATKVHSR